MGGGYPLKERLVMNERIALNHAIQFIDRIGRARVQLGQGRQAIDVELRTLDEISPPECPRCGSPIVDGKCEDVGGHLCGYTVD